jgi:RNA polymerase sigma-70 factor, ECF subfamily
MAKRLVRAKYKIKAAKIPYWVPNEADLPERVRSVLSVLYLIYNTGLDGPEQTSLRSEAIRLVRALVESMPDEPEAAGLLALLLLCESRVPARTADHALVLLWDQDRTKWVHTLIEEGHAIVRACIRRGQPGPFHSRPRSKPCTVPPTRFTQPIGRRSSRSTINCSRSCRHLWSHSIEPSRSPRSMVPPLR